MNCSVTVSYTHLAGDSQRPLSWGRLWTSCNELFCDALSDGTTASPHDHRMVLWSRRNMVSPADGYKAVIGTTLQSHTDDVQATEAAIHVLNQMLDLGRLESVHVR